MEKTINVFVLSGDEKSQKLVLQACVNFTVLSSNAKFYYRPDPNESPYSTSDNNKKSEYYQRRIDPKRIGKIKKYLRTEILADRRGKHVSVIFPTAMLLSFDFEDTLLYVGGKGEIPLPQDFFIVDGQHRLRAMMDLYNEVSQKLFESQEDIIIKEYLEEYKFNCTIMLNFDMWEQAQVFADVNFTQSKVNRSLYYDIYGMRYPEDSSDKEKNCIYVAHQLVKHLNSMEQSPFYGKIKMLGNGTGLLSQACMVEALMRHMSSPLGIWYIDDAKESRPSYKHMAVETISFFCVVKKLFPDKWPDGTKHRSIICKTTGVGALIRLLGYIHKNKLSSNSIQALENSDSLTCEIYMSELEKYLQFLVSHSYDLFDFNGQFSGTGGKGLEFALYKEFTRIIENKQ